MRRSTKILLAGFGLSALVLTAGYLNTLRLEKRENALRADCTKPSAGGFDLSTAVPADLNMDRPWAAVTADPIFQALNSEGQERARQHYFERHVLPRIPHGADVSEVRAQFDRDTKPRVDISDLPVQDYFVPPDKVPPGANVFDQFDNPPPKWAIAYVRSTYPQYNDLSDEELGRRLHNKYGPARAHGPLVCDAEELSTVEASTGGIQAKIVQAHRAVTSSKRWPLTVALSVLVLSALPWAWYALLRRIGELRAAIGGKPPEL